MPLFYPLKGTRKIYVDILRAILEVDKSEGFQMNTCIEFAVPKV